MYWHVEASGGLLEVPTRHRRGGLEVAKLLLVLIWKATVLSPCVSRSWFPVHWYNCHPNPIPEINVVRSTLGLFASVLQRISITLLLN